MSFLRQLLVRFSVEVDDKPVTALDQKIEKLKQKFSTIGKWSAGFLAAEAAGAYFLVEAASKAEESLNVLQVTFGKSAQSVEQWSKSAADTLGRSMYEMQDSVGRFGAFLEPTFRDSNTDIAMMSQKLSELSVDLASFYNTSDEEASMRLFSGMSGETEAVRRLGVDISDKALEAWNKKAHKDTRNMQALTLQEKTMLRYEKIINDTRLKQGDAARTAGSWANMTRRLNSRIKTLAVDLGKKLMPAAKMLLRLTLGLVEAFDFMESKTSNLRTALMLLTGTAVAGVGMWAAANVKLIASILGVEAALGPVLAAFAQMALLFLAVEDFITFLRGGESAFGNILEAITGSNDGLKTFHEWMQRLIADAVDLGHNLWEALRHLSGTSLLQFATGDADALKFRFGGEGDRVRQDQANREANNEYNFREHVRRGDLKGAAAQARRSGTENEKMAQDRALKMREEMIRKGEVKPTLADFKAGTATEADLYNVDVGMRQKVKSMGILRPATHSASLTDARAGSAAAAKVEQTNNNVFNINGGDPEQIKKAVREVQAESNGQALQSLSEAM